MINEIIPQEISVTLHKSRIEWILSNTEEVVSFFRNAWSTEAMTIFEDCRMILLDSQLKLIGHMFLHRGTHEFTPIDAQLICGIACKTLSAHVIIAHNHPNNNNGPSEADILMTEALSKALNIVSSNLLDHIILTETENYSFRDNGGITSD